jgi:hypothetical protein
VPGPLPAIPSRIIVAVDVNFAAFPSAKLPDAGVAPIIIWSAAVNIYVPVPTNVGAVKCVDDDGGIAKAVVNAPAPEVGIGSKVAKINEGVTFRADIAGGVDP